MNYFKVEFSFDDGSKEDIRVAELLKKYGFTGTFFIPTNTKGLKEEGIKKLVEMGMEIGGHTVNHPSDLKLLNNDELKFEIGRNKEMLENLINKDVTKFCYPRGRYNYNVKKVVKECGFKSARTTKVLDIQHQDELDLFEIRTSIHIYQRPEYDGRDWLELAKDLFLKAKKSHGYFHVWGHGWELTKFNNWEKFENLLSCMKDNL